MTPNPLNPSFRKPHNIPQDAAHPLVRQFARDTDKSITDLNQAVASLKGQISATSTAAASTTTVIENISSETTAGTVTGGVVNNQTGVTAYTTQQSDNAGLVILDDASAIAVTLDSTITIPYFTTITNAGTSTATVTPSLGTVNGLASIDIPGGSFATIFFDGTDWWADAPGSTPGGVTQLLAGTNVTLSPPGGMGVVTVNATAGSIARIPHFVTGSRSFGGIFQNLTGQEMWVTGYGLTAGSLTGELTAFVDTVNPPLTDVWGDESTATVAGGKAGFGFIVPNNYFYKLIVSAGTGITSLGKWVEYY